MNEKERDGSLRVIGDDDFGIKRMINAVLGRGSLMRFKPVFCGANVGMFIFDPRGDVYRCWEFVGQDHGKVGRYWPEWKIDDTLLDQWRGRSVSSIPKCSACKYALFCGGGCEAFAYEESGCFLSSYCDDYPTVFAKFAPIAYTESVQEQRSSASSGLGQAAATTVVDANNQITPPERPKSFGRKGNQSILS